MPSASDLGRSCYKIRQPAGQADHVLVLCGAFRLQVVATPRGGALGYIVTSGFMNCRR